MNSIVYLIKTTDDGFPPLFRGTQCKKQLPIKFPGEYLNGNENGFPRRRQSGLL